MLPDIPSLSIGGRCVGRHLPPFVVAEIGLNHGGSADRAIALVEAAAAAGAHAIKLQTIAADALVAPSCPPPAHVCAESLVDFLATFELDRSAHRAVIAEARAHGLRVLSTPLSEPGVDLLDELEIDAFKIASGDLTYDDLIARCAATGKPLILSTGMSTLAEIRHAVTVARQTGASELALLHCVSAYPVPHGSENLLAVQTLHREFRLPVGLSDHAPDASALPLAVALGASLYERHLVLDGDTGAVDLAVSSTSTELAAAIEAGRRAWVALGHGQKACLSAEAVNVEASRRSLCAARDLPADTELTRDDLVALRPATGMPPSSVSLVCGLRLKRALGRGAPIMADDLWAGERLEHNRVA